MSAFQNYTSSCAFRLDLSGRMIEMLVILGGFDIYTLAPHSLKTLNSLIERGLVEKKEEHEKSGKVMEPGLKLTPAGQALLPLLALAGHDKEAVRRRLLDRAGVAA